MTPHGSTVSRLLPRYRGGGSVHDPKVRVQGSLGTKQTLRRRRRRRRISSYDCITHQLLTLDIDVNHNVTVFTLCFWICCLGDLPPEHRESERRGRTTASGKTRSVSEREAGKTKNGTKTKRNLQPKKNALIPPPALARPRLPLPLGHVTTSHVTEGGSLSLFIGRRVSGWLQLRGN